MSKNIGAKIDFYTNWGTDEGCDFEIEDGENDGQYTAFVGEEGGKDSVGVLSLTKIINRDTQEEVNFCERLIAKIIRTLNRFRIQDIAEYAEV